MTALLSLIKLDIDERYWDFFWDFLDSYKWQRVYTEENQFALAMLIAPYIGVKIIDWILAGRK